MKKKFLFIIIIISITNAIGQVDESTYFNYLQQTYFENSKGKLNRFLIEEFYQYQLTFPNSDQDDQVLWMLGDIFEKENKQYSALIKYIKIYFLHPKSKLIEQVRLRIKALLSSMTDLEFTQKKDQISKQIIKNYPLQNYQDAYFEWLSFIYSLNISQLNSVLLKEINLYNQIFKDSFKNNDALCFWQGCLYEKENKQYSALIKYIKIYFLHPKSKLIEQVRLRIKALLSSMKDLEFTQKKDQISKQIIINYPLQNYQEAYFEWLSFIYSLNISRLNSVLLKEINLYNQIFKNSFKNNDALCFWQGCLYEKENNINMAAANYTKLLALYPESIFRSLALYKTAYFNYSKFGEYNKAIDGFLEVINSYSTSDSAGNAQFYLAELYETGLKNNDEALNNYRLLLEAFPDNPLCLKALKRIAKISYGKKQYEDAAAAYMQLFEKYPDDDFAPEALDKIETIYSVKFKDFERSASILKLYASHFKTHENAAEHLYRAAEIYAFKLDNISEAVSVCQQIIKGFKGSDYADKAEKLIKKL